MWKLLSNVIAVKHNVNLRGMNVVAICPICGNDETREFMVFGCNLAEAIWFEVHGVRVEPNLSPSLEPDTCTTNETDDIGSHARHEMGTMHGHMLAYMEGSMQSRL